MVIIFRTGGSVEFEISGPSGILSKESGKHEWHPATLEKGFVEKPSYSIISVRGTAEIYEQRKAEPVLYITDDPKLMEALRRGS